MSVEELGQPFDIHTGGVDLIFPHHENEIAQSTAADGEVFARFFAHNEHLLVEGRKMSKSLNNFYTLEDIQQKGFEPVVFRLLVLQAHYRSQADFSWEGLEAAQSRLKQFRLMTDLRFQAAFDEKAPASAQFFKDILVLLEKAAENDLDTPQALTALNKAEAAVVASHGTFANEEALREFNKLLGTADKLLGLQLAAREDADDEIKNRLVERDKARQGQDWKRSDAVRDELAKRGIELLDTPRGMLWTRIKT